MNKIIEMSVATLNMLNVIDEEGDNLSFENLTESISTYGVMEPIFVDSKNNVISGCRRVLVARDLLLDTIPAIVIADNTTEVEIEKLRIDFLLTNRNISHLDIIKIYYHQNSVFEKYNEPYTEYMAKLKDCTQRDIQSKVKAGRTYSTLPYKVKNIIQSLDSMKKVPLKTFKVMSTLEKVDLDDFIKEVLEFQDITHTQLVSVTKKYDEMLNEKRRNKDINKGAQDSKTKKEETLSNGETPLNEVYSSANNVDGNTAIVMNVKKVFQYEIKKYFNQTIDIDEERDVKVIQSNLNLNINLDFKEEIDLISSFLQKEVA